MLSKLDTLSEDLGKYDKSWVTKKVYHFITDLQNKYKDLDEKIERLKRSKAELRRDEREELKTLKKMHSEQRTEMERTAKLFETICGQEWIQVRS